MFRNRIPGQPSHCHSPSLDTNLFLNQSSDSSVQELNFHHNFNEISVRSENRVNFLSSHPLGDAVLQFSSSRKKKLKNKRHRGKDKKFIEQRPADITDNVGSAQELKQVGQKLTPKQNLGNNQENYQENYQVIINSGENKGSFIERVRKEAEYSPTECQKWGLSESSSSQFRSLGLMRKNSVQSNKIQKNNEFTNLRATFDLVEPYDKQGQSIMMARTKAPTKNGGSLLKPGQKQNLINSNNLVSLTKLTKERKRRSYQFQEDLSNVQTNKKIQKLFSKEYESKINTKNKIHLQYSSDGLNSQISKVVDSHYLPTAGFSNSSKENHFPCTFPFCSHEKVRTNEDDKLETRIGLRTKINATKTNEVFNISEINNELDLGLKIIDDSFEISGVDDSGRIDPWVNIQMLNTKNSHIFNSKDKSKNSPLHQEIVLDQSLVSPECHKLKQHLNSVLANRQQSERAHHLNEVDCEDWAEDNVLQKIPILQMPSFHKQSLNSSVDRFISPPLILNYQKDLVVHELGLILEYATYTIINPMEHIQNILDQLIECKSNRNIIGMYQYIIRYVEEDRGVEIAMFRQPTLPHFHPHIYTCQELISGNTDLKLSQINFKSVVRDLLCALSYCSKIAGFKINLQDIYLCKNYSHDYTIKIDPTNISSYFSCETTSLDKYNVSTIIQVISYFNSITELSILSKKIYANLMEMIEEGLSYSSDQNQMLADRSQLKIGELMQDILLHPFLSFNSYDTYSQQIVNFLY